MESNDPQMNQVMLMSQRKSVGIAILLSILVVGLGFAYLKDFERFLVYFLFAVVIGIVNIFLIATFNIGLAMVIYVLLGVFYIFQIVRVYQAAEEYNNKIMMDMMNKQ